MRDTLACRAVPLVALLAVAGVGGLQVHAGGVVVAGVASTTIVHARAELAALARLCIANRWHVNTYYRNDICNSEDF